MIPVYITDYESGRQDAVILGPDEFHRLEESWFSRDKLLVDLQHTHAFHSRERWCDLEPPHWRFLIGNILDRVAKLSDEDRLDSTNPTVDSLGLLLGGLIISIQQRADCRMQMMDIVRNPGTEVVFRYNMVTNSQIEIPKKPGLKVIVDNTKE